MSDDPTPFQKLLIDARGDVSQRVTAKDFGVSVQYYNDLEKGRRGPNPVLINRLAVFYGLGDEKRKQWHRLCARQVGWDV